jgi:EAL domain-containing protein (putative c-di-GMP-specific phosphodiesterase class I)
VLSSTTAPAPSRFLLPDLDQGPIRCYPGPAGPAGSSPHEGPSSPAGLHSRPWLARLRRALERDLFVLHYQPIVSLRDGRVSHYEALLRLVDDRSCELVAPGEFLPAAERYGLIRAVDRLVLGKAIALLGERDVCLAINLSARSVTDVGMLAHVERQLALHGVDPARLVVEITETEAISDMGRARAFCAGLRALGCAVALDDFGAGFGSFRYLKHLPFDYLKIDGDFIRALPRSPKDQLVVEALVALARGMAAQTIAEFVGDDATLALLCDYGVDFAQGFALGRPHPVLALAA